MMKAVKWIFVLSLIMIVLLVSQGSFALPAGQTAAQVGLDEDEQAALAQWGSTVDPTVAALLDETAVTDPTILSTLDEVVLGYDKATGQYLDDPTITRYTDAQVWPDDEKAPPDASFIRFGANNLLAVTPGLATDLQQRLLTADAPSEYLALQFTYPVDLILKEQLSAQGVVFGDPLNSLSFYAKIPAAAVTAVTNAITQGKINFVGQVPPAYQISEGLQTQLNALDAPETAVPITVQLFEAPTETQLAEFAKLMTIERRSDGAMFLIEGWIPANLVYTLAANTAVQMVHEHIVNESGSAETPPQPIAPTGVPANLEGNLATGGDILKLNTYDGTGINVMIMDSGIAHQGSTYHPDLPLSRITDQYAWYPLPVSTDAAAIDSHGTHVAGSIGGSGNGTSGQSWQGIAPGVNLLIYRLCCNVPGGTGYFNADFQASLVRGAANNGHVSNNSWGGGNGTYAVSSQLADRAVRGEFGSQFMNMVIITHNDNALSRSPGTAKNALTVGAVKDGNWPNENVTTCGGVGDDNFPPGERICFSNFGPIDVDGDGFTRVKPDIMAPGVRTHSAVGWYFYGDNRQYDTWNGTSMAAPQVTGGVAQFLDAYPGYLSWPEVVKAVFIASATNVGGVDVARYGRGMVNTYHAVYDQTGISDTSRWTGSLAATGNANNHNFTVPAGFSEVRVVLTWADPVAGANNDDVINDLDLRVYDANNVLRGSSITVDDTVEYVKITTGTPGTWRIEARAFSLASSQAYGLASVVVMQPANLSLTSSLTPNIGTFADNTFYLYTTISNSGFAAPGSYVRLQLPSTTLFTVEGARIYTRDGRSHYYDDAELHNDGGGSFWRVAVGESIANHPRLVRWFIRYNGATCSASRTFNAAAFFRDNGGLGSGGSSSVTFTKALCNYLPMLRK
ncbi:MAG: S8 family serine peptidase [Chloroflexi bacterium]|nr:S8 family serine peptidase [Chloroflexota bacterium]